MSNKQIDKLRDAGYPVIDEHLVKVNEFESWYFDNSLSYVEGDITYRYNSEKGVVEKVNTGNKKLLSTLRLPMEVSKSWASMFFNEKTRLKAVDEKNEQSKEIQFLDNLYNSKKLWQSREQNITEMFGVGMVGEVVEYNSIYGTVAKKIKASNILPLKIFNNEIKECAFVSLFTDSQGKDYTVYNIHREVYQDEIIPNKNGGKAKANKKLMGYNVLNVLFDGDRMLSEKEAMSFGFITRFFSDVRLFFIYRPFNIVNGNIEWLGLPIFYTARDMIKHIDMLYSSDNEWAILSLPTTFLDVKKLPKEFSLSSRLTHQIMFVNPDDSNTTSQFGGNSEPIHTINHNPPLAILTAEINEQLNRFSTKCGLGANEYKYNRGSVMTATQIISENQEKFVNLKKHYSVMESEFIAFNKALLWLENAFNGGQFDYEQDITYFIQDSVVVDDDTRKRDALMEFQAGTMSLYTFLSEYKGLSGKELADELERLGYDANGMKEKSEFEFNMPILTTGENADTTNTDGSETTGAVSE